MCKKFSAIYLPGDKLIFLPQFTDHHIDLIESLGVRDNGRDLVKLECSPREARFDVIDDYVFEVDQPETPEWWNEHTYSRAEAAMRRIIKAMIVDGSRDMLLGGCWVLTGNAMIGQVKDARIVAMYGSARVGTMCLSSQVEQMADSARVARMHDSAGVVDDLRPVDLGSGD